jgi:hypothetical protein
MKCVALTGISREVIEDITSHHVRTIELSSAHNIFSLINMELGDTLFLTCTGMHDLKSGTPGILAVIRALDIRMHRVTGQYGNIREELETMYARVQTVLRNRARVNHVLPVKVGSPILIEADEIVYFEAK